MKKFILVFSISLIFLIIIPACGTTGFLTFPEPTNTIRPIPTTILPSNTPTLEPVSTSTPVPTTENIASFIETATPLSTATAIVTPILKEPCISYYDATNGDLKFVCRRWGKWTPIKKVDTEGNVGLYSSLAFDTQSKAHISYYSLSDGDLKYASQAETGWEIETVDNEGDVGLYTSLAINAGGKAYISYYDRSRESIKVAWQDENNNWRIDVIEEVAPLIAAPDAIYSVENPEHFRTSIVLDQSGNPIVSYTGNISQNLKIARWDGTIWVDQMVDPSANTGGFNSMAINPQGFPGISYHNMDTGMLKYAEWDGAVWDIKVIDNAGTDIGLFTSLAFDSQGNPHIAYFDDDPDTLCYIVRRDGKWNRVYINPGIYRPGFFNSIALDQNDNPYIAYFEFNGEELRIMQWDGERFERVFVDAFGSVGWYPSIKFIPTYPSK